MSKHFNIAGAVKPDIYYCIAPLERINLAKLQLFTVSFTEG